MSIKSTVRRLLIPTTLFCATYAGVVYGNVGAGNIARLAVWLLFPASLLLLLGFIEPIKSKLIADILARKDGRPSKLARNVGDAMGLATVAMMSYSGWMGTASLLCVSLFIARVLSNEIYDWIKATEGMEKKAA